MPIMYFRGDWLNIYFKVGFLLLVLILGFVLLTPTIKDSKIGTEIVFFAMGEGDSILIRNKSKNILIDSGLNENKAILGDKLKSLGVKTIDYMILTHPDKDHIGGAAYILDNFNVENLIQSKYKKGNKAEIRLKKSLENKPVNNRVLTEDFDFILGDLKVQIFAPMEAEYKNSNDYSLVVSIQDRNLNYLFAGDIEKVGAKELISKNLPPVDLFKVPHHGRWNSASEDLILSLKPKISVITSNIGEEDLVKALEVANSNIYYAFDKDIYFFSDGVSLELK